MNVYYPITQAIGHDADVIINSLNTRVEEIKRKLDKQSIIRKASVAALKVLGLAAGIVTVAALPVAAMTFTATPLMIAAASFALGVTCMALCILLDPRNAGESIVKDHWKALFEALRKGNGKQVIHAGRELIKQKDLRPSSYEQCLGQLHHDDLIPFFHKTSMIGYLLMALENLHQREEEKAKSNAHVALSHFDASGLPSEAELLANAITANPKEVHQLIVKNNVGRDIRALDYLITLKRKEAAVA